MEPPAASRMEHGGSRGRRARKASCLARQHPKLRARAGLEHICFVLRPRRGKLAPAGQIGTGWSISRGV